MERIWNLFMYAIKKPNKFEGRACRMEAISFALVSTIIFLGLIILMLILIGLGSAASSNGSGSGIFGILSLLVGLLTLIFGIILLVPGLGVGCRRLHDLNLSGWLQLLYIVPVVNSIVNIVFFVMFYFIPGTEGDNQYGRVSENY